MSVSGAREDLACSCKGFICMRMRFFYVFGFICLGEAIISSYLLLSGQWFIARAVAASLVAPLLRAASLAQQSELLRWLRREKEDEMGTWCTSACF